jgi:uncharacterized protein YpmB
MSLLIFIMLISVILIAINPSIVIALNASNNEPSNDTDFGGLSAESTDIAEANKTDLKGDGTSDNASFGGLSAESTDIAEANKTDLITGTKNNNSTDFGGLSARSVNITK